MADTPCQSKEDATGENRSNQKNSTGRYQLSRKIGGVRGQTASCRPHGLTEAERSDGNLAEDVDGERGG